MSGDWRTAECPPGVTRRILLMRHGETDASAKGRCYGKLDVPLSEEGRLQVERACALIQPLEPELIITSPRIRASDSAAIIAKTCRIAVGIEERFAELDFGDCEGLRYEEVERKDPEFYARWMSNPTEVTFPNGESYVSMSKRVIDAYEQLIRNAKHSKILVVAHGGVNRIILAHVLGIAPEHVFRMEQTYACLNCVEYYDTTPLLRVMNAVA